MTLREKFGKLVLLEETGTGALGLEYRAARLGPAGLDRLVTVLRFGPAVSADAEATKRLMDEARLAARLQSPGLVRVLGIGRVGQSVYVSTELVEGRTVEAILDRCRTEGFPFAAEHALMIASRAAAALEFLHGKKDDAGHSLCHGLVAPSRLAVAFDGEVKLKGLGLWPALRGTELLPPEERRHLAPEQVKGEAGEARSDVYALGLVLLEALTGQAPDGDPLAGLASARITGTTGETGPLPKPLAELLRRALGREPSERFSGMADLRKAIDALLFSGDFTPTTFDLAFFMHTLFREDMEREARALEDARRGDYGEFLPEEKPAVPASPGTEPDSSPPRRAPTPPVARPAQATTEVPSPTPAESARLTAPDRPPAAVAGSGPDASGPRAIPSRASRDAATREAASRMTLGATESAPGGGRGLWLTLGLLGAVVVGGGAGWFYFVKMRAPAVPAAAGESTTAAQERVRELEARVAQLEREKSEAVARAADEARRAVEAQAATGGRTADPKAVAQAQEEARRRVRAEQEARQQEELHRIAEEKTAEEQRAAAQPSPTPSPVATPTPTAAPATPVPEVAPASTPVPTPAPNLAPEPAGAPTPAVTVAAPPGTASGRAVADPKDPAVQPPVLQAEDKVPYPSNAVNKRITATVVVRALIDEQGRVGDATVIQPSGQPSSLGFDEAALKRVRSRRYRPARRQGVPIAIWVLVRIDFKPPAPGF